MVFLHVECARNANDTTNTARRTKSDSNIPVELLSIIGPGPRCSTFGQRATLAACAFRVGGRILWKSQLRGRTQRGETVLLLQNVDISVIIPTRNRAAWLPTCLAHLEQQTFPAGRFEVLVVDDGSTDDTVSVLERFASGAPVCIRNHTQSRRGLAAACNLGAANAIGDTLLFLSDDELVSPRLLELYQGMRERQGPDTCIMGDVHRHPQLPRDTFTRLFLDRNLAPDASDESPAHFLDWQSSNFCLDRQCFLDAGGFETDEVMEPVAAIELASRLASRGISPRYLPDARVYVWQPTTFAAERRRQYRFGYALKHLQARTRASAIPRRFRLLKSRAEQFLNTFTIPFYIRACNRHESESNMLIGNLYKRVLHYDRCNGYQDALLNRALRPPAAEVVTKPITA